MNDPMNTKPATITTPTHAMVVSLYFFLAVLGVTHIVDIATATSMREVFGEMATDFWALALVMSGTAAAGSVLIARKAPTRALSAEFWAAIVISILMGAYAFSLFMNLGANEGVTTKMLALAVSFGGIARAVQARRDRARALKAIKNHAVAIVAGEEEEG